MRWMTFLLTLPVLLGVGVVVAVLLLRGRRGLPGIAGGRGPRRRHLVVRIICGVLGVGILVAIGIGTWMDVRGVYAADAAAENIKLRLPTRPAPALEKHGEVELKRARMLIHLIFLERGQPVHAETMEMRLPQDRNRTFRRKGRWRDVDYDLTFVPEYLRVRTWNDVPGVALYGDYQADTSGPRWNSSGSGGFGFQFRKPRIIDDFKIGEGRSPLSVVPGLPSWCRIVAFTHRVSEDDPLKEVALGEYFSHVQLPAVDANGQNILSTGEWRRRSRINPDAPPFFHFVGHIGLASLFLLVAAALLAQLFARRGMGFAATLSLCILFVAVLDRSALAAHAARLEDDKLPVATRCLAAESLAGTFFYRKSAGEIALAIAKGESVPELLRKVARQTAEHFRPKLNAEFYEPEFSLGWDLKHAENADFQLEEKHAGNDGYFLLHVPANKQHLGVTPDFKINVLSRGNSDDYWSAYLPLSWDNGKLSLEFGSHAPSASYGLFLGTMNWSHEFKRVAPNIITIVFHLKYVPNGRRKQPVTRDVSITVEVQQEGAASK